MASRSSMHHNVYTFYARFIEMNNSNTLHIGENVFTKKMTSFVNTFSVQKIEKKIIQYKIACNQTILHVSTINNDCDYFVVHMCTTLRSIVVYM